MERIKVTQVRSETVHIGGIKPFDQWDERLVADGKLVLVECKVNALQSVILVSGKYIKPIVILETERINDGNYVYDSKTGLVSLVDKRGQNTDYLNERKDKWFKVLVLPEQFSPEQLQMIVDGKIKDEDKVLVECESKRIKNYDGQFTSTMDLEKCYDNIYQIKLNSQGHVTLHKVEEKLYTRDEVIDFCYKYKEHILDIRENGRTISESKWFEENIK